MPRKARPDPALTATPARVWVRRPRMAPWPWCAGVARSGAQAWPVPTTACSWRKIAAAMTVWAWVGLSLFCLAGCQVSVAGCVDRLLVCGTPHRPPRGGTQRGPARAGQPRPAGEGAGHPLPRGQAGVLDHRSGLVNRSGHRSRPGSPRPDRGQAGDRGDQLGQLAARRARPPSGPRCQPAPPGRCPSRAGASATRSSAPGDGASTPAGSVRAANTLRTIRRHGRCLAAPGDLGAHRRSNRAARAVGCGPARRRRGPA